MVCHLTRHRAYPAATLKVPRLAAAAIAAVLLLHPDPLQAQEPRADDLPRVTARLRGDSLVLRPNLAVLPGGRLGLRTTPVVFGGRWEAAVRARIAAQRRRRRRALARPLVVAVEDTTEAEPGPPPGFPPPGVPRPTEAEEPAALDALAQFADLGLQLRARFEMKIDRLRNLSCTSRDLFNPVSGCQGGFPTPALNQQFNVRAGGVVGERVHINVDFDSEREFSANNNINVYYQGLEDEILRRLEVGNVSFSAPASRFITAAIPANSFGIQAEAQLGAFEFRAILAQQKGSQLRSRVYTVGERTTQPVDRELRDLDFERGRFFFIVDPRRLPGFPAVDVLSVGTVALDPGIQPVQVRIYRLRAQTARGGANPNLGGIDAVATRSDSPQRVGPFPWELLEEGRDYFIDPTGLWFALGTRVGDQDFLAVSYITAAGDTVGTFPAVNSGIDTLELIYEPRRGPEVPTFDHELRNVYRIGSNDISRRSIELTLVVNESEQPLNGQGTYLSHLGLALVTDQSTLDEFNRVFPRARDPNSGAPIRDFFVIFPHLRPFADSTRLQEGERSDSLYRTPAYLLNTQGPPPRFRLRLHYEAVGAGDRGTLNLGAFQIREGSEKLFLGNRQLVRDQHYQIDYSVGQVIFLNPDSLFAGPVQIRAQFEENQLFDEAPKSIIGLSTTYDLGGRGQIHAIGLLQRESSLLTRPQLGFEPQSNFIGGISTQLQFRPDILTRALDALPLISTSVPSRLTFNGEVAVSRPNPNQAGEAFLEEFEGTAFRPIGLLENSFQLGSRPVSGRGLPATHLAATGGFADLDAVPLIWQNTIQIGEEVLQFEPRDIDSTIILSGAARQIETVLWITMKPDTVGGVPDPLTGAPRWFRQHTPGPRWRSISQPFSGSRIGIDLSRVEFLEFWVLEDVDRRAKQQGATVVFDFGTVFEDAVAFGPQALTVVDGDTAFSGFRFLGRGRFDTERDTLTNIFNAAVSDLGIHGDLLPSIVNTGTGETILDFPTCELIPGAGLPVFPLGDLGAQCTRRNGFADSEDLDGDGRLDVTVGTVSEDVFRYVLPIGDDRFFVRNGVVLKDSRGRPLVWRLYRIPFREDTLQIGLPNIRQIQALRITVVAPDRGPVEEEFFFALARMRLVGAPWLKRAATPIAGIGGSRGEAHGEVIASVVTTENRDLGYTPPPGVVNQADRQGAGFELFSQQINEKSLRLLATDLRAGERAEAFIRFTDEADKNFLQYRKLRVWARGRGPGWEDRDLEFFIKVGRDEHNFYMYSARSRTVAWEPEVVVDLNRWLLLRAEIESTWLRGEPPSGAAECGGDSTAFVACDGPYLVQVRDPGISPPNLARVSEIAVGMRRIAQTVFIGQAELWVDDIRLSDVVDDAGIAGAVDVRLQAADVADVSFGFSTKDDRFQQLGQAPSYVTDASVRIGGTFRLEKLFPGAHLSIPIGIQHQRASSNPFFLNRSDVRGDALRGLRRPNSSSTTYTLSVRRLSRGEGFLEHLLVDPVSFNGSILNARTTTELSEATTTNRQFRLTYNNVVGETSVKAAPGFLVRIVDALPGFIGKSEFGKALRSSRLRVSPFTIRGGLILTNNRASRFAYRVPVTLASDTAIRALQSINHTLRSDLGIDLRPFRSLTMRVDLTSTRNLQDYGDSTTIGRLLRRQRRSFIGQDVGFEQLRTFATALNVSPVIASWLAPRLTFVNSFTFNRDPNRRDLVRLEQDSVGGFRLPETLANAQRRDVGVTFTVGNLFRGVFGDSSFVTRLFRRIQPIDLSVTRSRRSSFNRAPFGPSFRYQLAFGDIDEFRFQDGFAATAAAETQSRTAAGGLRLPLNLSVRLNYRDQRSEIWSRRGTGNQQAKVVQRTRQWPAGNVSWSHTPRWFIRRAVSILSLNARGSRTKTENVQQPLEGVTQGSRTENVSTSFTPSATITWVGGIVTSLQVTRATSNVVTSGNITRREEIQWGGDLSFAFRPPRRVVRSRNEIRTTVSLNSSLVSVCILRTDSDTCTTVSDSRRTAFDVRMDSGFSTQVRGGLSFSLVRTEQKHTSTKFSQIIFTIFAEVFFVSAQLR